MREVKTRLVAEFRKPVISLYGANALIDTGADIPVCYFSSVLIHHFNGKRIAENVVIGTFGEEVNGDVYEVERFCIGELSYPGLKFYVPKAVRASEYLFILSASMFDRLVYEIDKVNEVFTVRIPDNEPLERHIILYDSNGNRHVLSSDA